METEIKQILTNNVCSHHYTRYRIPAENVCDNIGEKILNILRKGKNIDENVFNLYIDYITKNTYPYSNAYQDYKCICKNKDMIKKYLMEMFTYITPTNNQIAKIIEYNYFDDCFKELDNSKVIFNNSIIDVIIKERLKKNCNSKILIDILLKFMPITYNNLSKLVNIKNDYLLFMLSGIIDKVSIKFDNNDILHEACSSLPQSIQVISALISRGLVLDSKCLEIVCEKCSIKAIKYVLENGRINITKNHFQKLINTTSYYEGNYTQEKMELLINYGYKLDYDDIIYSIKRQKEIPNVDRFNIKLDQKVLELCWEHDFYPNYKFDCISEEMIQLEKLCLTRQLTKIKKHIENFNLVPDRKCMENACNSRTNGKIVDYLISKGGKINIKCILKSAYILAHSAFLIDIIKSFEKNNNEYIAKLENHIVKLGGKLSDVSNDKIQLIDEEDDDDSDDNDENEEEEYEEKSDSNDEYSDDDAEDVIEINDKLPKVNFNTILISEEDIKTIQNNNKNKTTTPQRFLEIFKATKSKRSYLDVKKYLINEIGTKSWFDSKNKDIINLPDDIKKKLQLDDNVQIKFNDIDKLVCLFYK